MRMTRNLFYAALLLAVPMMAFGVADGYVVKVENTTVYLDWGTTAGIIVGDQFEIYSDGEVLKHPVTGASLGKTQRVLGQGVIESIQEKYSTGKIIETKGTAKPGDHVRYKTVSAAAPIAGAVAVGTSASAGGLKELWRSEAVKHNASGIALGDLDGDKKNDVVVAYRDGIEAFRWNGTKLETMAYFKQRGMNNFLSLDTADVDGLGHDRIFASHFSENNRRSKTIVLELVKDELKEVGSLEGYVRVFPRIDGRRELVWQDISMARELRIRQPSVVVKKGGKYTDGDALKLPRVLNADQFFGYAWGDWDADNMEDFAFLSNGEKLRVFFKDAKWSSKEVFGGSKLNFSWENEQYGNLFPRMVAYNSGSGKPLLILPHNIPATGIRLARLKIYNESEIMALQWNGLEMTPVWKMSLAGSISDFAVGDAMGQGRSQLWIASVGAGEKTVIVTYQIP